MPDNELIDILTKEINEEVLSRMPEWFRILRDNYKSKAKSKS